MWRCSECGAEVEDDFEVCWSCSTARSGASYEEFHADIPSASAPAPIAALEVEQIAVLQAIKDGGKTRNGSIRACPTGLGIATTSRLMMSPIHVRCADLTTWN